MSTRLFAGESFAIFPFAQGGRRERVGRCPPARPGLGAGAGACAGGAHTMALGPRAAPADGPSWAATPGEPKKEREAVRQSCPGAGRGGACGVGGAGRRGAGAGRAGGVGRGEGAGRQRRAESSSLAGSSWKAGRKRSHRSPAQSRGDAWVS